MLKLSEFFEVPEGVEFEMDNMRYIITENVLINKHLGTESSNRINFIAKQEIKILPPKKTISEDEKVILRNLPSEFTWIARDADDRLDVYTGKPTKRNSSFGNCYNLHLDAFRHLFQCITFEDEEATLIADLLKGE